MNIVLVGCGKFGSTIARLLSEDGHNLTIIESDRHNLDKLGKLKTARTICGNASDFDVLESANVASADICITCTASDETNLLVSHLSKQMGAAYTIARLRDLVPGTEAYDFIKKEMQIDLIVSPEYQTAQDTFKFLTGKQIKTAMLLGATRIAIHLSQMLLSANVRVTVIDRDEDRCNNLCDIVPSGIVIINDKETDKEILLQSGITETDALVSLTPMDEENILTSLFAMECKVPNIITKIDKANYTDIVHNLNLENVVAPRTSTSKTIIECVRRLAK